MPKYARLHRAVKEANLPGVELHAAHPATEEQILRVHTPEYFYKVVHGGLSEKEIRRVGFPWSPELVTRSLYSVGGTIDTCRSALADGISANLAGGTHHAYADHGEGYCVFNDAAVALRAMQAERRIRRALILDCDVHQGNGTAAIFAADPSVITFSIHGEKNFPFHKERSDLDIALPDGSGDETFLAALKSGVERIAPRAGADLVIYIAGADPYIGDRLGRLAMSIPGLEARDRWVLDYCSMLGLPTAIVMGGGYARQVEDVVQIHLQTIRLAAQKASQFQFHSGKDQKQPAGRDFLDTLT